ncbi:hypothetical protein BCR32DRAFT_292939 [Anaeromyces robustus]|jgi:hypothetical protein|uniref:RlpA-like protein double-psi beta-barrel domain-containing protein n=1 Tax=Anaeromyces robustus TaxID=1754192 RepID=A0A1Y1X896_9FUNG|nr:hypothetical protein BCR32DRAFT_292939 [Anaeromyces robustus]|eukprot:ORX81967.1 hypothetical protein BCR32DRAFT_292939 [Anaeromyces robustus]
MKLIYFSLLFAFFITLINADGKSYHATFYGGSDDGNSERNPSCYHDMKKPDTDYYAAVGTLYDSKLCGSYAVVMGVERDSKHDGKYDGKMVKVKIMDSCRECKDSHIDLSRDAFAYIRDHNKGELKIIWLAATSDGDVKRDVIYPSEVTEEFAKKVYGMSKSQFVSAFKKQALRMIKNGEKTGRFNKSDAPATTTTTRKTTTTTTATSTKQVVPTNSLPINSLPAKTVPTTASVQSAVATEVVDAPVTGISDIIIQTGQTNDTTVPDEAPIVGKTKTVDPNKTDLTDEDIKIIESQFKDKEDEPGSYTVGVLSAGLGVTGAAGIGLLYLKKKSPSKYDELKEKFPEAFNNVKRSVSRSATSIRRGLTRTKSKSNTRTNNKVSRHGDHSQENYRELPQHMFGKDGIPRYTLYDAPMNNFPETSIRM